MKLKIETTADGSPTFYREDIDEHYHSIKGAIAEGRHVYIEYGWREASASISSALPIRVFEVGFGTGLNATLTAQAAFEAARPTEYYSVELYPLPLSAIAQYAESLPSQLSLSFNAVNSATWQEPIKINPYFTLTKLKANLLSMELPEALDVVYFDAFAPEKQPEMWDEAIFRKLFQALSPGGIITTYCAKGVIRRMLGEIGFFPERLPGPPSGKREILRARRVR